MATVAVMTETLHLCPCCEENYIDSPTMVCGDCDRWLTEQEAREMLRFEADRDMGTGQERYTDADAPEF